MQDFIPTLMRLFSGGVNSKGDHAHAKQLFFAPVFDQKCMNFGTRMDDRIPAQTHRHVWRKNRRHQYHRLPMPPDDTDAKAGGVARRMRV